MAVFDFLIVAAILAFVFRGWVRGLEATSVEALELLACLAAAVMLHETVAGFVHAGFSLVFGDGISTAWSILLAFGLLAWGSFAAIRLLVHAPSAADGEDQDDGVDPLGDRVAGAVAGGFGGAVFVGGALVTISMVPFLAGLKPSGDRMLLDVGKTVLRAGGQFAREIHEGRSLPVWGEPASRMADQAARLTSEPWFDVDADGNCTAADRFRDVDGNGTFSKDLYFTDVDGDGTRRIGLIDKYVAGRWDAELMSEDRPRPDQKKKEEPPAKPAAVQPAPAPKPAATTPPVPKPPVPKPAAPQPAADKPKDKKPASGGKEPQEPAPEKQPTDDF